jgi:phytoene desaturase
MGSVSVIGSGFAGLAAASVLAKNGLDVTVYEKNDLPGGRARKFESSGFVFDMGPSWYWMPDVFEKYFRSFNSKAEDFYRLVRLDPSYRVYFGKDDYLDIPSGVDALFNLFEQLETGSGKHLLRFLAEGKTKYDIGINKLVYKPGISVSELADRVLVQNVFKLHVFQSIASYIRKFFRDPRIIKLLEFPVLFLGATPEKTPALYSLMNYADMALGTWYPMGGMYQIVEAMTKIAKQEGAQFRFNSAVTRLEMNGVAAKGLWTEQGFFASDYIVAGADYHHVEQTLIPTGFRKYSSAYWESRVMAPSCLIFYIGLNKRVNNLRHHTLFFDEDFAAHARDIYESPRWPEAPQFYVSCPSRTDPSVAPSGCENLMILIPLAPGLDDDDMQSEKYFTMVIGRLENMLGEKIRDHIIFKRSYAHRDFVTDYNAFRGNAYGLANTLMQTANLKPSIVSKKIRNLFYTGQLTVPGPGVPPSIISGQVVAREVIRKHQQVMNKL